MSARASRRLERSRQRLQLKNQVKKNDLKVDGDGVKEQEAKKDDLEHELDKLIVLIVYPSLSSFFL